MCNFLIGINIYLLTRVLRVSHSIWVQTMIHPRLSLYKCVAVLKAYDDYQKIAFSSVNTLLRSLETMNFYLFLPNSYYIFIPYYLPESFLVKQAI